MTPVQRIRVPAGFLFGLLYLYFSSPRPLWFAVGMVFCLLGLALRFWASGYLEKGRRLATRGPYARTRNPLYLGSFLLGLGFTLASSQLWLTALYVFLFAAVYRPVMRREEEELSSFGPEYRAYREGVPLFFPRARAYPAAKGQEQDECNFLARRAILNGEYRTVIGFLIVAALSAMKMLWT